MIVSETIPSAPAILLSIYLIIHLLIIEFSEEKIKKILAPLTISFLLIFFVVIIKDVFLN